MVEQEALMAVKRMVRRQVLLVEKEDHPVNVKDPSWGHQVDPVETKSEDQVDRPES